MLQEELDKEVRRLEEVVDQARKRLADAPEGSLRVNCSGKLVRYQQYLGRVNGKIRERYLRKDQRSLALQLAQKDYDLRVLKQAERDLASIRRLSSRGSVGAQAIKRIYAQMGPERKSMVVPFELPDDDYALLWERENQREPLISITTRAYQTEKGDLVRSKSEVIIADKLHRAGVRYLYERPCYIEGLDTVHPDFTVLNKRTRQQFIWEHFGLMDDPDYRERALRKVSAYARSGLVLGKGLIATFETAATPLDVQLVDTYIRSFCQ
ncbi:MAG: hypothetical protein Q4D06_00710 [Coriobacteriia bacterium]|nr:hypothetical protein [Coriobacteriia bacterium]